MTENNKIWLGGYFAGLREYAWWKDGVQYVGGCGTTLSDAIKVAERDCGLTEDEIKSIVLEVISFVSKV